MVTITDAPEETYDLPSFRAFLAAREAARKAATHDILSIRARKQMDVERLHRSFDQQTAELSQAGVPLSTYVRLRAELELQRRKDVRAARAGHDVEIKEIRRRYGLEQSTAHQSASDFRDYMHAARVHQDDSTLAQRSGLPNPGFDPVLMHLPQVRRRRDNGWLVYESPDILSGRRELLRCNNREIVVRGADDDRVRAAMLVASERYSPPLQIAGSDKFKARAQAIAAQLGLDVATETIRQPDSTPHAKPSSKSQQPPQPEADSTPDVVAPAREESDFSVDRDRLAALAKEYGKSFVVPGTTDKIEGDVLAYLPDEVWSHSPALLVSCNERAAVIVPVGTHTGDGAIPVGTRVQLLRSQICPGKYNIQVLEQAQSTDSTPQVEPTAADHEDDVELAAERGASRRH